MKTITRNISLKASLESIWNILTQVEETVHWVKGVQASKITSADCEGIGLCWEEKVLVGEQTVDMEHEVLEWVEKEKLSIHTKLPMGGHIDKKFLLQETNGQVSLEVSMSWDFGIAAMLFGEEKINQMMEKSLDQTLESLTEKISE